MLIINIPAYILQFPVITGKLTVYTETFSVITDNIPVYTEHFPVYTYFLTVYAETFSAITLLLLYANY